jgi:hypothetical protein
MSSSIASEGRSGLLHEQQGKNETIRPELRNSCSAEEKMTLVGYEFLRQSLRDWRADLGVRQRECRGAGNPRAKLRE